MSDIGVEVGQKMRLAIKAKLTELNCYVDDELPDYIMVMIANKRTKAQMKEDLSLFLTNETSFFVEWLHIVLKKLKQVHVTNPNVFKNSTKRKSDEYVISHEDFKRIKNEEADIKMEKMTERLNENSMDTIKSLTDDLPITANKLTEIGRRKIVLMEEEKNHGHCNVDDDFDIPLLSEINSSNEEELQLLEKRIKNVKSRLGLQVESDKEEENEDDGDDCLNIKPDPGEMEYSEQISKSPPSRRIIMQQPSQTVLKPKNQEVFNRLEAVETSSTYATNQAEAKKSIRERITFDKEKDSLKAKYDAILKRTRMAQNEHSEASEKRGRIDDQYERKKRSILDRLGKRPESKVSVKSDTLQSKIVKPQKESRKYNNSRISSSVLSRVGVMSKVSIPQKKDTRPKSKEKEDRISSDVDDARIKNVPSVIKVKPRILPSKTKQANPSLLFKAVAEAQRSVSQTPAIGKANIHPRNIKINEPVSSKDVKSSAPALFTKKYKEMQLVAAKEKDLSTPEKNKRSIIINKNKTAKLLEDDKLKLRILLTKQQEKIDTNRILQKTVSVEDELKLEMDLDFNNDFEETESLKSNQSEKSSHTPELLPKPDPLEQKVFLKRKIIVENIPQEDSQVPNIEEAHSPEGKFEETDEKTEEPKVNQKFIVTLDGIDKLKFSNVDISKTKSNTGIKYPENVIAVEPMKTTIKVRRNPSPIIFDAPKPMIAVAPTKAKPTVAPKKIESVPLPVANTHVTIASMPKKIKEKCKFFPNCRQGDRCEFLHATPCKLFPNCKFAEQCNYAHPVCKFETSCTRKNCPYSHPGTTKVGSTVNNVSTTICKYFPNCTNASCTFYHPKMCKYGIHCKNATCIFQHPGHRPTLGNKLTWRPDK